MVVEGKVFWGLSEKLPGGTASRIKVYGEKKENSYLRYSSDNLRKEFPPIGNVFVADSISSFYSFTVEPNFHNKKTGRDVYIAVKESLHPIKFSKLLTIKKLESSLPLEEIQNIGCNVEDGICFIKVICNNELLGPFIKDSRGLYPKTGKDVSVYEIVGNLDDYLMDNDKLLFTSPDSIFAIKSNIDCMSGEQLQEWFRNKLKEAHGFSSEIENAISIMIKMLKEKSLKSANDLDTFRFSRILESLDQYKFSYAELKDLFVNDGFEKIGQKIDDMRSEIKQEYESKILAELESLEKEKVKYESEKVAISSDVSRMKAEKEQIENEVKLLNENRESLILQIKLNAQMGIRGITNSENQNTKPACYEIQKEGKSFSEIEAISDPSKGLELHYRIIEKNLGRAGYDEKLINLYKNTNNDLLKSQAVFIPCISWAYIYAQSIGNAKVYTMHIEHDWLHYKDFCDNGLISIWNEAAEEKDTNYILVLEDLNLTQPECGLTPLLDVINGYRPVLEGTGSGLPKNLKIFATMIPLEETNVGLKLSERLFHSWGQFGDQTIDFMYPVENKPFSLYGYFEPKDLAAL